MAPIKCSLLPVEPAIMLVMIGAAVVLPKATGAGFPGHARTKSARLNGPRMMQAAKNMRWNLKIYNGDCSEQDLGSSILSLFIH